MDQQREDACTALPQQSPQLLSPCRLAWVPAPEHSSPADRLSWRNMYMRHSSLSSVVVSQGGVKGAG